MSKDNQDINKTINQHYKCVTPSFADVPLLITKITNKNNLDATVNTVLHYDYTCLGNEPGHEAESRD